MEYFNLSVVRVGNNVCLEISEVPAKIEPKVRHQIVTQAVGFQFELFGEAEMVVGFKVLFRGVFGRVKGLDVDDLLRELEERSGAIVLCLQAEVNRVVLVRGEAEPVPVQKKLVTSSSVTGEELLSFGDRLGGGGN